ncbi:MAG: ATP-binding cassette domain-containing protein [Clostridia bacterium]|nr:ATP-binding cassette domain-containing protein [Clostridia bacterium]
MLQIKEISKSYTTGDFTQKALDEVSVSFRKNEFVAILGPSGSGKTTFLNVIGGLDKYDSGDLVINGRSTKDFADSDWDAYRNNSIGFVFQSYNLITHLSILDNVEMGMTLSGVSDAEKRQKALDALERVGLKNHVNKKPNQLSGGQMQRVAIARALANDPDIILADEPTGALDKKTSRQIMDLIKEIADDKLVIMVTHNPALAEEYADRIVKFEDGCVIDDSNPYNEPEADDSYALKKTSMSFRTALKLSARNIMTKKGRTILTALASSIGIIGIALILSLSDGLQIQIDKYQSDALNEFPLFISQQVTIMDEEALKEGQAQMESFVTGEREMADTDYVILDEVKKDSTVYINQFSDEYMSYLEAVDPAICSSIGYARSVSMNVIKKNDDGNVTWHTLSSGISAMMESMSASGGMGGFNMTGIGLSSYPETLDENAQSYLEYYYDVLEGAYPQNPNEVVLVVDSDNTVSRDVMASLGFDSTKEQITFKDIVGTEYELVGNDVFYTKSEYGIYIQNTDYNAMYGNEKNIKIKISGVVRLKAEQQIGLLGAGIAYSDDLVQMVIDMNKESQMVNDILTSDIDVTPTNPMNTVDDNARTSLLLRYGGSSQPFAIFLYPSNFEEKELLIAYLDAFNEKVAEGEKVYYTDASAAITEMTNGIMKAVTLVLVAFAAISLVVSLIMIAIITYISVLERTKEIGILRALGARKKDITRVFNAETFIIGVCSGTLGIIIAYILTVPINMIIYHLTELKNVAVLNPLYALGLATISVILTIIGGMIPARMAAKKDPVTALRSE